MDKDAQLLVLDAAHDAPQCRGGLPDQLGAWPEGQDDLKADATGPS